MHHPSLTVVATAAVFWLHLGCGSANARPAKTTGLASLSAEVEAVTAKARRAVVHIAVEGYVSEPDAIAQGGGLVGRRGGAGTGLIVSADGYVLTNAHVIAGASRVDVLVPAATAEARSFVRPLPKRYHARVLGTDAETDLALLKIDAGDEALPTLVLGDSDTLKPGRVVLAMGSPFGFEGTVTMGVVSAVGRQLTPDSPMAYIQTDASMNPGNSGGPLLDLAGNVVGINTQIYTRSGGSHGLGFAVPSNIAKTVFDQLQKLGRVRRGTIGINGQTLTPGLAAALGLGEPGGVLIADVYPFAPAAAAGLLPGDVITSLAGKPMENARQLDVNLYGRRAGQSVRLLGRRGTAPLDAEVMIVERPVPDDELAGLADPRANQIDALGIVGIDLTMETAQLLPVVRERTGVIVVASANQTGPRQRALHRGDIIHQVNATAVADLLDLREALTKLKAKDPLVLRVSRRGRVMYVEIPH